MRARDEAWQLDKKVANLNSDAPRWLCPFARQVHQGKCTIQFIYSKFHESLSFIIFFSG